MEKTYKDFIFEIKSNDVLEDGTFKGYGSTFGGKPDAYGDVVKNGAFVKSIASGGGNGTGIALLWQHNASNPIGIYTDIKETSKGLWVEGKINLEVQQGREAHSLLKMGAVKGLSIGFSTKDSDYDDEKGIRYLKEVELWEISIVTFPANTRAKITSVKAFKESLKEAKTEREIEKCLREAGISKDVANILVTHYKEPFLREAEVLEDVIKDEQKILEETKMLKSIQEALKNIRVS